MACPTSLYRTLMAASQKLTERAVNIARKTKRGKVSTAHPGVKSYHVIMPKRKTKEMERSIIPARVAAMGKSNRGKYTFVIRLALFTTLRMLWLRDLEK